MTSSAELTIVSPQYVINSGNNNFQNIYSWGAIATGKSENYYNTQTAIVTSLSESNTLQCNQYQSSFDFSIMETLPKPIGFININDQSIHNNKNIEITLNGIVNNFEGLIAGYSYYTTTLGTIIAGDNYYGSQSLNDNNNYVNNINEEVLVSSDSFIGIAISETEILLKL